MKYRIHIHHLLSNTHFFTPARKISDDEIEEVENLLQNMARGDFPFYSFKNTENNTVVIPKQIIEQSAFYLEKVKEDEN